MIFILLQLLDDFANITDGKGKEQLLFQRWPTIKTVIIDCLTREKKKISIDDQTYLLYLTTVEEGKPLFCMSYNTIVILGFSNIKYFFFSFFSGEQKDAIVLYLLPYIIASCRKGVKRTANQKNVIRLSVKERRDTFILFVQVCCTA